MISASFAGGSSQENRTRVKGTGNFLRALFAATARRGIGGKRAVDRTCNPPGLIGLRISAAEGRPAPLLERKWRFSPGLSQRPPPRDRQRVFPDFTRCFGNRSGRLSSLLCGSAPGTGDDCKAFPPPGCGAPSSSSPQKTEDGSATFRPLLRLKGRHEGRSRT